MMKTRISNEGRKTQTHNTKIHKGCYHNYKPKGNKKHKYKFVCLADENICEIKLSRCSSYQDASPNIGINGVFHHNIPEQATIMRNTKVNQQNGSKRKMKGRRSHEEASTHCILIHQLLRDKHRQPGKKERSDRQKQNKMKARFWNLPKASEDDRQNHGAGRYPNEEKHKVVTKGEEYL
ncbi:hypothetical protein KY285_023845 [Solanum tuberosum]|nr:hypothetical protein KY289_024173 [Solanum tuberosum]KAH0676044.1 hypothetical protein KY285_023845 [Solanum tuberosum]